MDSRHQALLAALKEVKQAVQKVRNRPILRGYTACTSARERLLSPKNLLRVIAFPPGYTLGPSCSPQTYAPFGWPRGAISSALLRREMCSMVSTRSEVKPGAFDTSSRPSASGRQKRLHPVFIQILSSVPFRTLNVQRLLPPGI